MAPSISPPSSPPLDSYWATWVAIGSQGLGTYIPMSGISLRYP